MIYFQILRAKNLTYFQAPSAIITQAQTQVLTQIVWPNLHRNRAMVGQQLNFLLFPAGTRGYSCSPGSNPTLGPTLHSIQWECKAISPTDKAVTEQSCHSLLFNEEVKKFSKCTRAVWHASAGSCAFSTSLNKASEVGSNFLMVG